MYSLEELWYKTLNILKSEVSSVSFDHLLVPLKPVSINKDTIIIEARNIYNLQTIQLRYLDSIQKAILDITAENYKIKLITPDQNNQPALQNSQNKNKTLNSKYTFDNFVVGNSNSFAHAGALAIAEMPGQSYNPLFIYGGPGLGKTHIMHAIGNHILSLNPNANIMYVTSETFTNELIYAIQTSTNIQFRERYRNCDVLLIDDIQFISGKESTHEEFFHTFNTLYESNKQIVISSDKPPKDIPRLEERLRSRFEWGLIADIQKPDYETRVAILQKKAELDQLIVPDEVIKYIADVVHSNIRELEGSLSRVQAYCNLQNCNINLEITKQALKGTYGVTKPKTITAKNIKEFVCEYYNISIEDIESAKRNREIATPRQIAMYIIRILTDMSYPQIGETFGGKDHTTALHAFRKIEQEVKKNHNLKSSIDDICNSLKQQ